MRPTALLVVISLFCLNASSGTSAGEQAVAYVKRTDTELALGNGQLELKFRLADGPLHGRAIGQPAGGADDRTEIRRVRRSAWKDARR